MTGFRDLAAAIRGGLSADAVLLSAVWMPVRPSNRLRAFRKLISLRQGGNQGIMGRIVHNGIASNIRCSPLSLYTLRDCGAVTCLTCSFVQVGC
jgi:hypothetical protein